MKNAQRRACADPDRQAIRVLHVINGLGRAGAETALYRLTRATQGRGLHHVVLSISPTDTLAQDFRSAGARVYIADARRPWRLLAGLRRLLRSEGPFDVVQGWMAHGNVAAWALRLMLFRQAALSWNLRSPLLNTVHEKAATMWLAKASRLFSRSVDLLLANSPTTLIEHLEAGYEPKRSMVIPNGFDAASYRADPELRRSARRELKIDDDVFVIGMVGRYHPVKGHRLLIEAAGLIARDESHRNILYLLVGKDVTPENGALQTALSGTGVADCVHMVGMRSDLPRLLNAMDVFCLASAYESFPNVLGEAMAAERLCVSTDVSDVADIMDGTGILLDERTAPALADALLRAKAMSEVERAERGRAARQRIIQHYSMDGVARAYLECYRTIGR